MSDGPEVEVRFAEQPDGSRIIATSPSFAVFWRDQFGSVHFFCEPEPWWRDWFDRGTLAPEHSPDGALSDDEEEEQSA